MAEQTDANNLAELARYLREQGFEPQLCVTVDLHGAPVTVTLDSDGTPLPKADLGPTSP